MAFGEMVYAAKWLANSEATIKTVLGKLAPNISCHKISGSDSVPEQFCADHYNFGMRTNYSGFNDKLSEKQNA